LNNKRTLSRTVLLITAIIFTIKANSLASNEELIFTKPIKEHTTVENENKKLTIQQLIAQTIQNNPETLSKRAALKSAESAADAAFQQFFPSPYAQVINNEGSSKSGGNFSQRIGIIGIQQPLWTGGKLTANLNIAKSAVSSADISILETQLSLALRVVDAYQGLMQYRGRIEAQNKNIDLLNKYSEKMARRVENGASAHSDEALVAARIAQEQSDLESYKGFQRILLDHLNQLTGQPLKLDEIEFETTGQLSDSTDSSALIAQAIQINPTLLRLHADLETIQHEEEQQRAALMPTLSVKAESRDDLFRDEASGLDSAQENLVYATLEFNPGAGLSSLANIESTKTKTLAQKKSIEAYSRELSSKIIKEQEDLHSTFVRDEMLKRTVRSSQEVLASYDRLFAAGKRSWLDVLNAARDLMQPEISLADNLALNRASAHRLRLYTTPITQTKEPESSPEPLPIDGTLEPPPADNAKQPLQATDESAASPEYDSCVGVLCPPNNDQIATTWGNY
jgi:adhesin transport system outer membrane protein